MRPLALRCRLCGRYGWDTGRWVIMVDIRAHVCPQCAEEHGYAWELFAPPADYSEMWAEILKETDNE